MAADRLAEIKAEAEISQSYNAPLVRKADVLVLVKIAQAANDLRSGAVGYRDGVSVSRERYVALTTALALLDSGAVEGDA